jgi:hypothetical protein
MNQQETIELRPSIVEVAPDHSATVALGLLAIGSSMAVAGVFILAGTGWALIAGSVPIVLLALTIFRGMKHGA